MSKIDTVAAINAVNSNPFAVASKNNYRFQVKGRGNLSVSDLWNMSIEELSDTYKALDAISKKSTEGRSLLEEAKPDVEMNTKKEIIEIIFNFKRANQELAARQSENRQYMQRVADALQNKRDKALENMTEEQLEQILRNGGPIAATPEGNSGAASAT